MNKYERDVVKAQKQLYAYALNLTHDTDRANDLLQSTSLRILTNAHNYTDHNAFYAWAKVVMWRTFLNDERVEGYHARSLVAGYDDVENATETVADCETEYTGKEVFTIIKNLPAMQAMLLARRIEGYRYEEIAEEMGLPIGTVKSQLFAAKKQLKKLLEM
jgi:RNA polymerase sigma-70 factor (ECF subfamily)